MGNINEEFFVDPNEASDDELQRGMELLAKERERKFKIKKGLIKGGKSWSEKTEEEKESSRRANRKRNTRINLLCQKATEAGITVSDEEVDAAMAKADTAESAE